MNVKYKTFNLRLSPSLEYETNIPSLFKTTLPKTYIFDSQWSVGLKSISFPNSFKIFTTEKEYIQVYTFLPDGTQK